MKRLLTILPILVFSLGCESRPVSMDNLKVPKGFKYETSHIVTTDLLVQDQAGKGIANHAIRAYAPSADGKVIAGNLFFSGKTNADGKVTMPLRIPSYWKTVLVTADADGTSAPAVVPVTGGSIAGKIIAIR